MIYYAVIDDRGAVLRTGVTQEDFLHLQADQHQFAVETDGTVSDALHYFADGAFWEYPHKESEWLEFDFIARQWKDSRTEANIVDHLASIQIAAIHQVNARAGEMRAGFITVIPGQEMLYLLKEREAIDWLSAEAPNVEEYPLIAAEVGITAPEPDQVAQTYVNLAAILRLTAAQLETLRLGAVAVIEGATTEQEIADAVTAFMERAA